MAARKHKPLHFFCIVFFLCMQQRWLSCFRCKCNVCSDGAAIFKFCVCIFFFACPCPSMCIMRNIYERARWRAHQHQHQQQQHQHREHPRIRASTTHCIYGWASWRPRFRECSAAELRKLKLEVVADSKDMMGVMADSKDVAVVMVDCKDVQPMTDSTCNT